MDVIPFIIIFLVTHLFFYFYVVNKIEFNIKLLDKY